MAPSLHHSLSLYRREQLLGLAHTLAIGLLGFLLLVWLVNGTLLSPILRRSWSRVDSIELFGLALPIVFCSALLLGLVIFASSPLRLHPLSGLTYEDLASAEGSLVVPEELAGLRESVREYELRTRELRESRGRLFRHLSHQIKTPLSVLRLQGRGTEIEKEISDTVRSLSSLLDQMMALARADSLSLGAPELEKHKTPVNLYEIGWELLASRSALMTEKDLSASLSLADPGNSGSVIVSGIPLLLHDAIANLLDNAIRHSPAGKTIRVRVGTEFDERQNAEGAGCVYVEIEDDGPGVPETERGAVFMPFYGTVGHDEDGKPVRGTRLQGPASGSKGGRAEVEGGSGSGSGRGRQGSEIGKGEGTHGLGLSIVKTVADLHGGRVRFLDPVDGKGARVRLSFPGT